MDTIANWATFVTAIIAGVATLTGVIWAVWSRHKQQKRVVAHFSAFLEFLKGTPEPPVPGVQDDMTGWLRQIEHRLQITQYLLILECFQSRMPLDLWPQRLKDLNGLRLQFL